MLAVLIAASVRCAQSPAAPEAFLRWSMDRYHAMASFQATVTVSQDFHNFGGPSGKPDVVNRQVLYQRPNLFHISGRGPRLGHYWVVSDGKALTEYADGFTAAIVYPAPKAFSEARSTMLRVEARSPLYLFFAGSAGFGRLAKSDRVPVAYGAEESVRGEKCRLVTFFARGTYGHVRAVIGMTSGLVYKLSYDSLPLVTMMGDPEPGAPRHKPVDADAMDPKLADPANWFMTTSELYDFETPVVKADSFRARIPAGVKVVRKKTESD